MRPVPAEFPVNQKFGSYATAGVTPNQYGTEVQQLVYLYGNYQPYGHAGCDIACPIGTPVRAIADGTVLWADWGTNLPGDESDAGYRLRWYLYKTFPGIVTVIQHDGWISVYAHLSDAPLNPGDRVTEGQEIARSGNTRSPGVSLGAHLHVEALVDYAYTTGNGLIYGRTNPEPYFGGIAAMGSVTTQAATTQEDFMGGTIDAQQAEDIVQSTTDRVVSQLTKALFSKADGAYQNQLIAGLFTKADGAWQNNQIANLPAQVLNQSFKLADGTVTNLAGILTAIHAQPAVAAGPGAVADPQAIVDAIVNGIQLTRK